MACGTCTYSSPVITPELVRITNYILSSDRHSLSPLCLPSSSAGVVLQWQGVDCWREREREESEGRDRNGRRVRGGTGMGGE